jgi:ubiquinone/menaquinone biosynthesis C-methylase UbiE
MAKNFTLAPTQMNKTLDFSNKYDQNHSKNYFEKHERTFWRRLSNRRDQAIARKALILADKPEAVLDMPCGTGRFWQVLAETSHRKIFACDYSQDMIDTGLTHRAQELTQTIQARQGSASALPYEDDFVDCVFCIHLLHHISNAADRRKLLSELKRVSKSTIIISLWVDGNYQAWRRKKHERSRKQRKYQNRFIMPVKKIEAEFKEVDLQIIEHLDFLKCYSMWRTYIPRKT